MEKEKAVRLIHLYGEAWMERDADKILQVFTPDATYFDLGEGQQVGHEGIRKYWETKVIGSQKDIMFHLLNVWVDTDTVIGEWNTTFIDTAKNLKIDMTEVAIFGVKDEKFSSLREYYRTVKTAL